MKSPNYIAERRHELEKYHYLRKANRDDHWFDFSLRKVRNYLSRYGDGFCLVVFSDERNTAWVMPFSEVKDLFCDRYIDSGRRWVGDIKQDIIQVRHGAPPLNGKRYHNALDLLRPTPKK